MSAPKATLFLWNEDPVWTAFFIEEALEEWRRSKILSPFFVDCDDDNEGVLPFALRDSRDINIRQVKTLGHSEVPACRAEYLPHAIDDSLRRKQPEYFGGKVLFVVADEENAKTIMSDLDEMLFFAKAGPESISSLYRTLADFDYSEGRFPKVSVVVSGAGKLENAAEFFVVLRDEVTRLSPNKVDFRFAGSFDIDADKVLASQTARVSYRTMYSGDGMYGKLKYIGKRLAKSYSEDDSTIDLKALAEKVAALIL